MTPTETAAILRQFNEWRRDFDDKIEQPDSRDIGMALDAAVEMIERLEAAESEAIEQARLNGMGSEREAALMAKLEVAEKERDAAELMSIALRAKVAEMEKQEPVAEIGQQYTLLFAGSGSITGVVKRHDLKIGDKLYAIPGAQPAPSIKDAIIDDLQSQFDSEGITEHDSGDALIRLSDAIAAVEDNFAGAQPAPSAPSEDAAAEMGANGGHVVEAERLAFEAWMRGHCWKLGAKWTGTEYRSAFEKGGMVDIHAMRTRELWAAWRDRAALAAAPEAKP